MFCMGKWKTFDKGRHTVYFAKGIMYVAKDIILAKDIMFFAKDIV